MINQGSLTENNIITFITKNKLEESYVAEIE
jgi:hypothetical protein